MIDIPQLQNEIYINKIEKGFSTDDVSLEFNKLYREVGEAFEAYDRNTGKVGEELADSFIFLLSLAHQLNVNLEEEIKIKIKKNKERICNGTRKKQKQKLRIDLSL